MLLNLSMFNHEFYSFSYEYRYLFWITYLFQSSYGDIKWNSEFENLAVDITKKWKDTATCLNLIVDHFYDGILSKSFYNAITGIPLFKVRKKR